jgi:hypothetical protein
LSDPEAPAAAAAPAWRRFLWIGLALVALAAAAVLLFGGGWKTKHLIHQLSSRSERTKDDARKALRESTDPGTDDLLLDTVADDGTPFDTRLAAASLLIDRNRLVAVEDLARSGSLMTRAVILKRFLHEKHFHNSVVPDPTFRVAATAREWLGNPKLEARHYAIQLALELKLDGVMETIRPLLSRVAAEGAGREQANLTLVAALDAVGRHGDCPSLEAVARLASEDPDLSVRLAALQALQTLAFPGAQGPSQAPACPGGLSEERLLAIVRSAIDPQGTPEFVRAVRIKALGMVPNKPTLLPPLAARIREILDGTGNGAERRAALMALGLGGDAALAAALPRYMHDRDFEVRSDATQLAESMPGQPKGSLWIGILRDEAETRAQFTMRNAHEGLRRMAGVYLGLPKELDALSSTPQEQRRRLQGFLEDMVRSGAVGTLTREAWVETWFRWFAERHGAGGEALEAAVKARAALRDAMQKGDVAAFRAALDAAPQGDAELWAYERGWLAARP